MHMFRTGRPSGEGTPCTASLRPTRDPIKMHQIVCHINSDGRKGMSHVLVAHRTCLNTLKNSKVYKRFYVTSNLATYT